MNQIAAAANLGKFLQVVYSNGVLNQLNDDFRDWEAVTKKKVTDEAARSVDFMVQKSFGVAAVKWSKQGSAGAFPNAQQVTAEEMSAGFNQIYATVELEYDLWQRALGAPRKYAEPLALEIKSKGSAQKRLLSAAFHLDGSGVLATISSSEKVDGGTADNGRIYFSDGGARYVEYYDKLQVSNEDGTLVQCDAANDASYYLVVDKSRENDWIEVQIWNGQTADTRISFVENTHGVSGILTVGDRIIREDSERVDMTTFANGSLEVNNAAEILAGLESLAANDGRLMHGMTMSGITQGTHFDCEAQAIKIKHIQSAMDKLRTIVGFSTFKYKQLLASPEAISAFIDANEADRRLINVNDNKRGQKGFGYIHNSDTLELVQSEFVGKSAMWALPEGAKEAGVLELHGKDFVEVKAGGQTEFLKAGSAGYTPSIQKFMMAYLTLICKRPNAILKIKNFVT